MIPRELSEWILKITVGEATELGDKVYQNTACLMASRIGVVAAFYPDAKLYRTSSDGGLTWSEKMKDPLRFARVSARMRSIPFSGGSTPVAGTKATQPTSDEPLAAR